MYDMAENNAKKNFTEVSLTNFISLKKSFSFKIMQKKTSLTNIYSFVDYIEFIFFFLTWFDKILYHLICCQESTKVVWLLFEKLKGKKEAARESYSWK